MKIMNTNFLRESVPADLVCRGEISLRADTIDEEKRTVDAVIATETPAMVFDFSNYRIIEEVLIARGMEPVDEVPLLANHNRYDLGSALGTTSNIRIQVNQITARLSFVSGDPDVDRVWNKVKQRALRSVSVGYQALEFTDIAANSRAVVDGREWKAGPRGLRITTKWRLRENSIVSIGADAAAKIRSDAGLGPQSHSPGGNYAMNPELRRYLESLGLRREATEAEALAYLNELNGEQRAQADALLVRLNAPPPPPPAPPVSQEPVRTESPAPQLTDAQRSEAITAERARITRIQELGRNGIASDLVTRAINEGWNVERAGLEFLQSIQGERSEPVQTLPGNSTFSVHSRQTASDQDARVLAAGLMHRCGLGERIIDASAPEATRQQQARLAEQSHDFRHLTLREFVREACRLDGMRNVPHDPHEAIRAAVSGSTLTNIFTTSVNARLIQSYQESPDTSRWVRETDVADFKTNDLISLGKTGSLVKLPRGGEARHAAISDDIESYKIARYANQFAVDEQDIIDDSLNALMEMPMEMGMAAARLRPDLVYSILLANAALNDGIALFHSSHNNATDTAFSSTSFKTAFTAMQKQTQDGVNLNLNARYIISVPTLAWTIREYLQSPGIVIAGTAGSVTERGNANVLQGIVEPVIEARLENGVTDPSTGTAYSGAATKWFLAADAMAGRTIMVGYRAGTGRRPQVRSFTLSQGQWGIGWDINLDIGAKAMGYRGLGRGNS